MAAVIEPGDEIGSVVASPAQVIIDKACDPESKPTEVYRVVVRMGDEAPTWADNNAHRQDRNAARCPTCQERTEPKLKHGIQVWVHPSTGTTDCRSRQ